MPLSINWLFYTHSSTIMTVKDIKLTISKIKFNLDEISNLQEERSNIYDLDLTPSKNDNFEMISLILKTRQYFTFIEQDMNEYLDDLEKNGILDEFMNLVNQYTKMFEELSKDSNIDISEYKYVYKRPTSSQNGTEPNPVQKSVRFRDTPDDNDASELMGTRQTFQPYKDDPDEDSSAAHEDITDHQMFAQHQQTLMRQDQDLDVLHQLISRQHMMGQDINQELDDQLIILNDLEQGVDLSLGRLHTASTRLKHFRTLMRENGSLVTICTLTVILILLLVVLN